MNPESKFHFLNGEPTIFSAIPGMIYRCKFYPSKDENPYNYETVLEYVSDGSKEILGITPTELLEKDWNSLERLMHPLDAQNSHIRCYDKVSQNKKYEVKYRLDLPNGLSKWVWDMGAGVYDENGEILYFEGLVMDISEQKFLELELEDENRKLKASINHVEGLGKIIGKSEKMLRVYELVMKAAENDMNVIILGETGCGKDLIAQTIHEFSGLSGAYIPVNCSAIPDQLLESEFFGHIKGAFSSAYSNNQGFIAAADNGTLFLDEVGELPLALQAKLLRTLENKSYTPLGSNKSKNSNFRLISATNRDLAEMVKEKNMRSDFFYRLNVLTIQLPPLRERMEDVPLLVNAYLKRKGYVAPLSIKARLAIQQYSWPGNVRELHNFLSRLIVLGDVALDGLNLSVNDGLNFTFPTNLSYQETMHAFEKELIARALTLCGGHRGNCAKLLDLNLRTLQRKIKLLNIKDN